MIPSRYRGIEKTQKEINNVLDKIRAEIDRIQISGQINADTSFIRNGEHVKQMTLNIIDKYKAESDNCN